MKWTFWTILAILACITIQSFATPVPGKGLWDKVKGSKKGGGSSSRNNELTRNQIDALRNHENWVQQVTSTIDGVAADMRNALDLAYNLRQRGHVVSTTIDDGYNQDYREAIASLRNFRQPHLQSLETITRSHEQDLEGTDKHQEAMRITRALENAHRWTYETPEDDRQSEEHRYYSADQLRRYKNRIHQSLLALREQETPDWNSGNDGEE